MTFGHGFGSRQPDSHLGPTHFWLWRQGRISAWVGEGKARKTHEEGANGSPSKKRDLAGREDGANFTFLPSPPGGPAPFCSRGPALGRVCDCGFAAFLIGRLLLTLLSNSGPRIPNWGPFFPRRLVPGRKPPRAKTRHWVFAGWSPGSSEPSTEISPRSAPGLVLAELRSPVGLLLSPTSLITGQIPGPLPGAGRQRLRQLKSCWAEAARKPEPVLRARGATALQGGREPTSEA